VLGLGEKIDLEGFREICFRKISNYSSLSPQPLPAPPLFIFRTQLWGRLGGAGQV
jgi:hypothetical protein